MEPTAASWDQVIQLVLKCSDVERLSGLRKNDRGGFSVVGSPPLASVQLASSLYGFITEGVAKHAGSFSVLHLPSNSDFLTFTAEAFPARPLFSVVSLLGSVPGNLVATLQSFFQL